MVKEISIIIVILVIIFSANFIVLKHLEDTSDVLIQKIAEINYNIKENIDVAKELINELEEKWEETNRTWSTIVIHQELDQIELSLLTAKAAVENGLVDDALIEVNKLNFLLEHISEKESFKLKNIF